MLIIVLGILLVILLVIIAFSMLFADALRGAIGGRRTLERARRLLVVSIDDATERAARGWIERFRADHPATRCVPLRVGDGSDGDTYIAVQQEIEKTDPDGVVWALHESSRHSEEGPYAMARRELELPMDAIYVPADGGGGDR